jgi:uncharacterized protein
MNYGEAALHFECQGQSLVGIVSQPLHAPASLGVVIVVGGPQYRAGSHRQFVHLARALARAGITALRFDYRGMGDAPGELRNFEQVNDDIAAAITALQRHQPQLAQVVLWGLCDAASAALLYLGQTADPRVAGLVIVNPWVRSTASLAKAHVKHYYRQRLMEPAFWAKLLKGQVAARALGNAVHSVRAAFGNAPHADSQPTLSFQAQMATALENFKGSCLLLLSENDLTAREFVEHSQSDPVWQRALGKPKVQRVELVGADHTCSQSQAQQALEAATVQWVLRTAPVATAVRPMTGTTSA